MRPLSDGLGFGCKTIKSFRRIRITCWQRHGLLEKRNSVRPLVLAAPFSLYPPLDDGLCQGPKDPKP